MFVVRDIFQLKFGMAREAKALLAEGMEINRKLGYGEGRVLTDFTGPSYRLILESTFNDLADYEQRLIGSMGAPEWQEWYRKAVPLIDSSYREILRLVQ